MKLIDKDKVVEEIEKRINKEIQSCATDTLLGYSQGCVDSMRNVLSFLDTLEVKEVDINKEISQFIDANFEKATIGHKLSLRRTAKHFFEFGMRASNKV